MTIDINKLRRLTQAATPGPWVNYGRQPSAAGLPYSAVAAKTLLVRVYSEAYGDFEQETANAEFIAAANPAAVSELLDRFEAAENDVALKERVIDALGSELNAVANERDALRAKVAEMGKQEPVAWCATDETGTAIEALGMNQSRRFDTALYLAPGAQAQPAPSVPDTYAAGINAVAAMLQSKADEYAKEHGHDDMGGLSFGPGMGGEIKMDYYTNLIELVDDVRTMLATLPKGRHMLGVIGTYGVDGYVPAQPAPSVPDGYKLVPIVSTIEMDNAGADHCDGCWNTAQAVWDAMLAAAPEAKP